MADLRIKKKGVLNILKKQPLSEDENVQFEYGPKKKNVYSTFYLVSS